MDRQYLVIDTADFYIMYQCGDYMELGSNHDRRMR